ncbi:efflux RND transporter periplasmic adaptor subunit [Thalassobacillus pellis]|uniref:efflux RND transporter periplasmic adaptor subunit n=1 Tax=Thalassobacillus pellis TaxID=748008 RepID=UPI001961757A|nr:efflux RND transporter periplasmic adaptor subunit [Thalassobacillus pellis]MBM7551726.1 RND family efflux transporter MFP subunit [Thalassobacillus pellis]
MNKWLVAAVTSIVLTVSGCSNNETADEAEQVTPVEVAQVKKGDLQVEREITGRSLPSSSSPVLPRTQGEVTSVRVAKGDMVEKGDTIAVIDSAGAANQVELQEIAVQQAEKQLENARIAKQQAALAVENAKKQAQLARKASSGIGQLEQVQAAASEQLEQMEELAGQAEELAKNGTIPKGISDQAQTLMEQAFSQYQESLGQVGANQVSAAQAESQVTQAEERLRQAEAGVEQARLQVEQAQLQLEQARKQAANNTITAPASGEITSLSAKEGTFVSGQQPLATVVSYNPITIEAQVTADQLSLFKKGQEVTVAIDGLENKLKTTIQYVSSVPGESGLYAVEAEVENESQAIKPGMIATFLLPENLANDALIVPTEAVVQEGEEAFVYKVINDKAKKVAVTVVEAQSDKTAIKGKLSDGTTVVTTGQFALSDDSRVTVIGEDN